MYVENCHGLVTGDICSPVLYDRYAVIHTLHSQPCRASSENRMKKETPAAAFTVFGFVSPDQHLMRVNTEI